MYDYFSSELSFLKDEEREELLFMLLGDLNDLGVGKRKKKKVERIIDVLLLDRKTKQNIIWATDTYIQNGIDYYPRSCIQVDKIGGVFDMTLRTRAFKDEASKKKRKKTKAEVFTPSWLCNKMNNFLDAEWFGVDCLFNTNKEKSWVVNNEKIDFNKIHRNWKSYVLLKKLEMACGECPFIVSRYETLSGKRISINERIGFLDRKLRVINENVKDEKEWLSWVLKAYESTYGFEFQGDNLLIGRINLLLTFVEYLYEKFNRIPTKVELKKIAICISWNIWQMDGLTYKLPYGGPIIENEELENEKNDFCVIYDWRSKVFKIFKTMQEVKADEI